MNNNKTEITDEGEFYKLIANEPENIHSDDVSTITLDSYELHKLKGLFCDYTFYHISPKNNNNKRLAEFYCWNDKSHYQPKIELFWIDENNNPIINFACSEYDHRVMKTGTEYEVKE